MGRHYTGDRILGPYQERDGGWSYTRVEGGVRTRVRCRGCTSEAAAEVFTKAARDRQASAPPLTIGGAVDAFVGQIDDRSGNKSSTQFARSALSPLLERGGDRLVRNLTPRDLDGYLSAIASRSMATRRSYTKALLRFCSWLALRRHTRADVGAEWKMARARDDAPLPWQTPAGAREVGRGKPQLRNRAEAEAYLAATMALVAPVQSPKAHRRRIEDERRVAACLPLLCGLASGEVLNLRVGDVDLRAGVGYVRDPEDPSPVDGWHVKTASRVGEWEIPAALRPYLVWLTKGREPDALLIHQDEDATKPRGRTWLRDLVRKACGAARVRERDDDEGVPVRMVCPHGLRDTHATLLRVVSRKSIGEIAKALRHGDTGRTAERHYVGAPERRPALRLIVGGQSSTKPSTAGSRSRKGTRKSVSS